MNELQDKPRLSITGILIQDPKDKGYTAYFAEFPEVIAEGNTADEAKKNLWSALSIMLEVRKQDMKNEEHYDKQTSIIESFELEPVAV